MKRQLLARILLTAVLVPTLAIPTILWWFGQYGCLWCWSQVDPRECWEIALVSFAMGLVGLMFPTMALLGIWGKSKL